MVKAVIFDRDGVILDSEENHINSVVVALEQFGITMDDEDVTLVVARHSKDYADEFVEKYGFNKDQFLKTQGERYFATIDSVKENKIMVELIKRLSSEGMTIALTTSSSYRGSEQKLGSLGIFDLFKAKVTFDDCENRKPSPEPYLLTLERLGLDAKDCIVVEDSGAGVAAATGAGIKCIAIPNVHTKNHDFSKASYIVKSAEEIYDIIKKN